MSRESSWERVWPEAAPVKCPKCGSLPGRPCTSKTGKTYYYAFVHTKRIKAGVHKATADSEGDGA